MEPPILDQLRELVAEGRTADEATEVVCARYEPRAARMVEISRSVIAGMARHAAAKHRRDVENRAFGPAGETQSRAVPMVREARFRRGDGTEVVWAESREPDHMMRVQWQMTQRASVEQDIARHMAAVLLIREHDADRMDQVPDWEAKLADALLDVAALVARAEAEIGGASGEVEPPEPVTARDEAA